MSYRNIYEQRSPLPNGQDNPQIVQSGASIQNQNYTPTNLNDAYNKPTNPSGANNYKSSSTIKSPDSNKRPIIASPAQKTPTKQGADNPKYLSNPDDMESSITRSPRLQPIAERIHPIITIETPDQPNETRTVTKL